VGSGEHTYEAIHDWGELPAGLRYGNTHGVCQDRQGRIYVHHTVHDSSERHDTMVVFDEKGRFVKSWGKEFRGGAHGLHIQREGSTEYLYLCDTKRNIVVKTTLNGEEVWTIGYPEESDAYKPGADGKRQKWSPTNLAIAPNGAVYVADGYGSSYIVQYDRDGKYIRTFGGKGSEAGRLDCPHGITVDRRGAEPLLLVADRSNRRLQYLTLDGSHVRFAGGVLLPCHFDERRGTLLVPDLDSRVTLLDRNDKVLVHLGEGDAKASRELRQQARDQFRPGEFVCPHGACFDHDGNIFVVEWVEVGRVTKLRRV
jgi:DNA-binding beta-propeller fold protein YncE